MKGGLLLDVVVGQSPAILKLLASENQPLLIWRDPLLVLDLSLDVFNGIAWFDLKGDGLTRKGLHEYLHVALSEIRLHSFNDTNFGSVLDKYF